MRGVRSGERGQAVVEFAVIGLVLMMLTAGLVDVGRAFYQYNAVSGAARYGARWASVVGGTCTGPHGISTGADWCNGLTSGASTDFFNTAGNMPLQGNSPCPTTIPTSNYYTVSQYDSSTSTTIVGAIAQHFDTNTTSSNLIVGPLTPGFDLSKLMVCIQLPSDEYQAPAKGGGGSGHWTIGYGDIVTVYVYYQFSPASNLFGGVTIPLIASSQYAVEP